VRWGAAVLLRPPPLPFIGQFCLRNIPINLKEFASNQAYYVRIKCNPTIKEVYEGISGGGDACPCEIVPRQGAADPSWRYVLINTYGEPPSIVMAPRGAKITERLPELLMNYGGIKTVAPEFYRDVVSTWARACREPASNIREMKDFVKRYESHWADCAWEPE
jgi:hypothetical protein